MADSKKEIIFKAIEQILGNIKTGQSPTGNPTYIYENTVSYVDRQYLNFEESDVIGHPRPWIILNNIGEIFKPLPSRVFENKLLIEIVAFVETTQNDKNLDSLMNSLQKDVFAAILTDVELSGKCAYIMPLSCLTVTEMIAPFGAFVFKLEIIYTFVGTNL
jgi:hypothetical protein